MPQEKSRALRRHHHNRVLAYARRIVRHWSGSDRDRDRAAADRFARRLRDNLKYCRCYACRNPRWDGTLTRQEKRANAALRCARLDA
jgi:hypothetical protein